MIKEAEIVAEIVKENTKEIYSDGLKPAVSEVGKCLEVPFQFLNNVILYPLKKTSIEFKYRLETLESDLKNKVAKIPQEHLQKSPLNILGPTIEGMKYTIDEEDIRECFLNLLSSSMDKRTAMRFHTSYPEIIKQLEPDEARILDYLNIIRREIPVIDIKSQEGQGYHTVIKNYSKINWLESVINKENLNSYFDNLIRLNLIEISDGKWLSDDKLYTELENKSKKIQEEKLKIENGRVPKIKKNI